MPCMLCTDYIVIDGDDSKPSKKEDVHVPAANLADIKKTEELRQKMQQMKEKRRINMKLGLVIGAQK